MTYDFTYSDVNISSWSGGHINALHAYIKYAATLYSPRLQTDHNAKKWLYHERNCAIKALMQLTFRLPLPCPSLRLLRFDWLVRVELPRSNISVSSGSICFERFRSMPLTLVFPVIIKWFLGSDPSEFFLERLTVFDRFRFSPSELRPSSDFERLRTDDLVYSILPYAWKGVLGGWRELSSSVRLLLTSSLASSGRFWKSMAGLNPSLIFFWRRRQRDVLDVAALKVRLQPRHRTMLDSGCLIFSDLQLTSSRWTVRVFWRFRWWRPYLNSTSIFGSSLHCDVASSFDLSECGLRLGNMSMFPSLGTLFIFGLKLTFSFTITLWLSV